MSKPDQCLVAPSAQAQTSKDEVFVMYAASLIKTFENAMGPAFQNETGYVYEGEARGSLQVANMVIDGLRTPDISFSAGTVPIKKLMIIQLHLQVGWSSLVLPKW